ncbi:unnamed protein product [Fusarium fujikuroi]|nr:unnamed protein product [Fusarium fujikuroi]
MDVDPLVVAIFGPPPEGIDLSANSEAKNAAVVLTLLLISALFLAGRIVIRTQQVYGLSLDDYAIIISWVFVAATGAMVVVVGQAGAGKHVWALTIDQMVEVSKSGWLLIQDRLLVWYLPGGIIPSGIPVHHDTWLHAYKPLLDTVQRDRGNVH